MRPSSYENVREVGVDDWAWRKGVTYGSLVIDLKEGWPIDLLGDRETESFREWMQEHKQVKLSIMMTIEELSAKTRKRKRPFRKTLL